MKFYIVLALACLFVGCCEDKPCLPANPDNILFVSFDSTDLDTVVLRRYHKDGTYNNYIDSKVFDFSNSSKFIYGDSISFYFGDTSYNFSTKYDFEVEVPSTNKVTRISELEEIQTEQQVCILCDCVHSDCHNPIISYKIDGLPVANSNRYSVYFKITK